MAPSTYTQTAGIADTHQAFQNARQDAATEYGTSYSGTLAGKPSFVVVENKPLAVELAHQLAYNIMDDGSHPHYSAVSDKWGPAGAIALNLAEPEVEHKTIEVMTLHSGSLNAHQLAAAELFLQPDECLRSSKVTEDQAEHTFRVYNNPGKVATSYHVFKAGTLIPAHGFQDSFDSLQDAKNAITLRLQESLQAWETADSRNYEVAGLYRREGGDALACGKQEVASRKATLEVEIAKQASTARADGWLFFGWASC
jgi:hypothetical protein